MSDTLPASQMSANPLHNLNSALHNKALHVLLGGVDSCCLTHEMEVFVV